MVCISFFSREAFTCSKEDKTACCFYLTVEDVKPRPLNPQNVYQQFQIVRHSTHDCFFAKSVAPDGFPPYFLRTKWTVETWTINDNFRLHEARGIDSVLRARLPELNLSRSMKSSEPVLIGKWYCPFIFVKDRTLRLQVK